MKRLDGKVAVVTGAAQGIGASYARALAAEGARVVIADVLNGDSVARDIQSAGGQAEWQHCDVTNSPSVAKVMDHATRQHGGLDILVNNAAVFGNLKQKPFTEIASSEWSRVFDVNVRGVFECCKAASPHMKARGAGKIINISSGTVFKGTPYLLHYVASKGAVIAMTRSLARELGPVGVRVNCIAPGLVMSESVKANDMYDQEAVGRNVATRAIAREAVPDDLIGTLIFLCSAESDFVTGQTLVVDGGSVMH